MTGSIPGVVGEEITTTFTVDNQGSSLFSQTWGVSDFVSYRIEGASGWWIESDFISSGSGVFSTDAIGNVISAGTWFGGYHQGANITTSWAGVLNGGWWNNGANQVVCSASATDCVWAADVSGNLVGANWTAAAVVATAVPEPASIALLVLGLAGIGLSRKRKYS
ncbi:PEP-CTERM sorting domain-containing protein [Parahaliea mediterranea]|uniref:PEP-CTERM sorting domain-containing protein n=1 Tax=Parahaliea mediterranea TaxID=651086 RepID=UPI0013008EC6|nr:PEP-CTERM sorting domain-containing protein [Parahaliea mediterranea]